MILHITEPVSFLNRVSIVKDDSNLKSLAFSGGISLFFQCSAYLDLCILKDQVCCLPCPSVFLTGTYLWDSRGTGSENPWVLKAPRGDWEERRLKAEGETSSTAQPLGLLSVNVSVGLSLLV